MAPTMPYQGMATSKLRKTKEAPVLPLARGDSIVRQDRQGLIADVDHSWWRRCEKEERKKDGSCAKIGLTETYIACCQH